VQHTVHCSWASNTTRDAPPGEAPDVLAQVLSGVISATDVPFSSYVAHPRTPLHGVDARLKQAWLVGLVFVIPRAPWQLKLALVAATVVLALTCLPRRLSRAQLTRLLPLAALICIMTSLTADQSVPSAPSNVAPPELQGLPSLERLGGGYRRVCLLLFVLSCRTSPRPQPATLKCGDMFSHHRPILAA
jgi:hypothetical protein